MNNRIVDMPGVAPEPAALWDGVHKIPWNDPAFSARILNEHLSQEHDLASRSLPFVRAQADWIARRFPCPAPAVLDLGCGPGLYARQLAARCRRYVGLDFGPASIDYARREVGLPGCEFRLADVTEADFGQGFDLAMMVYGEFNVFSPHQARGLLAKCFHALNPGGVLLLELQRPEAVRAVGQGGATQTRAEEGGLFADEGYVCLTENFWYEEEGVALQRFHVRLERGGTVVYRSTTKAWEEAEVKRLLAEAGFEAPEWCGDWPQPGDSMWLVAVVKG
ncbi:class I SAM-dependent methyltransferase [Pseudodesulfovibrio indicus]|uniref:Methyltransferase family protein n=2 Tax=Pseudodesulfovibrio indicus TaxID=1716143 RepID=A0AA94PKL5_9BACT|nr:class I SAM-dependent methyltransferase [Pseudodesulfovibrio indicus]TDT82708.1 methyltransferase family protein [Pseudodesulfovibrio indicus]